MKKPTGTKAPRGNQGDTPTPRVPAKRRLKSAADLRLFMADLVNRTNRGEIDTATARTLGYLIQVAASIIQSSDLEARIAALESMKEES